MNVKSSMTRLMTLLLAAWLLSPALPAEVVASAGPEKITREELDASAAAEGRNLGAPLNAEQKAQLLQSMINQRLLVAEAKARALHKGKDFKLYMQEQERQALSRRIYELEVGAKAQVSQEDAAAAIKARPEFFETITLSQAVLATEAEAKALKAAATPKNFEQLAREKSMDEASKARGGDLGAVRRGMMLPELEKAVFAAKKGQIVGPLKSEFGWHVYWLRDRHVEKGEEALRVASQELSRARASEAQKALIESLRKKFKIEVNLKP